MKNKYFLKKIAFFAKFKQIKFDGNPSHKKTYCMRDLSPHLTHRISFGGLGEGGAVSSAGRAFL